MTSVFEEGGGNCRTKASFAPHLLLHSVASFFGLTSSSSNSNSNANNNITINTCKRSSSSTMSPSSLSPSGIICAAPLLSADAPFPSLSTLPLFSQQMSKISSNGNHSSLDSPSPPPQLPQMKGVSSPSFPSSVRIDGVNPDSKGAGPAFVGQVFSMCDPSGTGLMAVTTRLDVPFISRRTPEWVKRLFATITKNEKNGPVFRFFMDLGDAVSYVKRLNIPTGMVGACRLDVAYEHFKEKPHMFQFVPSRKQVKAANKLLKSTPQAYRRRRLQGVPVFTAQNLNIAIATTNGVKWYTPYFFDKSLLDSILEASTDQHFHTLIQNRQVQRRQDVLDDSLSAEVVEDSGENLFEPPEVQELLDEMGNPGIPLSVISKAAEIQILDVVDKVLLGNRWIRKATGIQPKFPYLVDSFEERSAASVVKAMKSTCSAAHSEERTEESTEIEDFRFPFGGWFFNPWLKPHKHIKTNKSDARVASQNRECINQVPSNPLLPKITMVGISTGEGGPMSRASLKKTMEDLTKELEQMSQKISPPDEDDPLFVANVGDYSGITRTSSS